MKAEGPRADQTKREDRIKTSAVESREKTRKETQLTSLPRALSPRQ
jgi:hypothetical protein